MDVKSIDSPHLLLKNCHGSVSWGGTRRIHYSQNRLSSLSWSSAQTNGDRCRSCRRATVSSALGGGGPTRCGTHRPASSSWLNSTQVLVATTLWGLMWTVIRKRSTPFTHPSGFGVTDYLGIIRRHTQTLTCRVRKRREPGMIRFDWEKSLLLVWFLGFPILLWLRENGALHSFLKIEA